MSIIKSISVECAFTKSLPNYQNVKPTAGVVIELEDGDNVKDVFKKAWDMVGDEIMEQVKLFSEDTKTVKKGIR